MLPREKLSMWGVSALSFRDLIAIIISSGTKNSSVFDISKDIEKLFKQGRVKIEDFKKVKGLGSVKAMKLACLVEISDRLNKKEVSLRKILTPEQAYETVRHIGKYKQEHFVCIFLNARFEMIGKKTVGIGTIDSVQVLPRDIILAGISFNANYVIMAHNHPSNSSEPSQEDIEVTKRIKKSLEIVGMELLEHLVVTNNSYKRVELL